MQPIKGAVSNVGANLKNMANTGLQTKPGQAALGAASNLYNKLPNAVRQPVQNFAVNRYAQAGNQTPGFTPNVTNGANTVHVDASTYVDGQTNNVSDQVATTQRGTAQSPLSQLGGSLGFTGKLPGATVPQGQSAYNRMNINNQAITGYNTTAHNPTGVEF